MKILRSAFLILSSYALTSCVGNDIGDQLIAGGEGPSSALGKEWKRADQLEKDGRDLVEDGEDKVAKGKKLIKKGERLKAETELAATRAGYLKVNE